MELTYPINLTGFDSGATNGDVVTRDGEYLGNWSFLENKTEDTGVFQFIAIDQCEPMFSEVVGMLGSGMLTGMAMSKLCRSIREWHEDTD